MRPSRSPVGARRRGWRSKTTGTHLASRRGKLVHIKKPLLRVPTLCIHLQSADERKAFAVPADTPVLAKSLKDLIQKKYNDSDSD